MYLGTWRGLQVRFGVYTLQARYWGHLSRDAEGPFAASAGCYMASRRPNGAPTCSTYQYTAHANPQVAVKSMILRQEDQRHQHRPLMEAAISSNLAHRNIV